MAEAAIVLNETAKKYLKGRIDQTVRGRMFWKYLQSKNGIKTNMTGESCTWDVQFKETPVSPFGDFGVVSYSRRDNARQLVTDWRGYKSTDEFGLKEKKMNAGDVAIYNRYKTVFPDMTKSMLHTFNGELYIDGSTAANTNRFEGLETFFTTGTTVAADICAQPNDTYAGRSTALAASGHGGTWSDDLTTPPNANVNTDWPDGKGDVQYDFHSPKVANYSSTGWGTGSTAWEDNCIRVLRRMVNWIYNTCGSEPDMHLLSTDLHNDYQNAQEPKQRIVVEHKESQDLGFGSTLNQDGVAVKKDYDCPSGTGYAINCDEVEFGALGPDLLEVHGPHFDPRTLSWTFALTSFGNFRWNVKGQGKFAAVA